MTVKTAKPRGEKLDRRRQLVTRTVLAEVLGHRFRAGTDVKFFVDVPDVRVHGGVAHFHLLGDFLVEKSFCQQIQNFCFAW